MSMVGVRWVPVTKKLPSAQRMVLLYAPSNYNTASGVTWGWYSCIHNRFRHWVAVGDVNVDNQFKDNGTCAVTHWAETPPPPR